jgi:cytochrome c556
MKVRTVVHVAVLVAVAALAIGPSGAQPPVEQDKTRDFMKQKLALTQDILAGLTEGNLAKVGDGAKNIRFLSYFEKWSFADRPEYKRQLSYFDFACQELVRQAEAKNLEGATLAYVQLTASCVQCHKVMRDTRRSTGP